MRRFCLRRREAFPRQAAWGCILLIVFFNQFFLLYYHFSAFHTILLCFSCFFPALLLIWKREARILWYGIYPGYGSQVRKNIIGYVVHQKLGRRGIQLANKFRQIVPWTHELLSKFAGDPGFRALWPACCVRFCSQLHFTHGIDAFGGPKRRFVDWCRISEASWSAGRRRVSRTFLKRWQAWVTWRGLENVHFHVAAAINPHLGRCFAKDRNRSFCETVGIPASTTLRSRGLFCFSAFLLLCFLLLCFLLCLCCVIV
jgi:hypothetical protein